jgi:geranylgeranyl reductase family protein
VKTDVVVIGAGPAGSAAALVLARHGVRVVLVDRHEFPRDKACGDALIPDALQALADLGLRDEVVSQAHTVRQILVYAPNGRFTTVRGNCACLRRVVFDDILRSAAVAAGATFLAPRRAVAPLMAAGRVAGARVETPSTGAATEIRADLTILATGAAADALKRFGVCRRVAPSAFAARTYVRVTDDVAREHDYFCVAFAPSVCPGYGWFFPGPDHTFNVGVGYLYDPAQSTSERNMRKLLDDFLLGFAPAATLMRAAETVAPVKGAPLRTALEGADLARPGLLVAGEAAGLTYSFSGEGMGKAMQSGIMAAQALLTGEVDTYAARLVAAFSDRFKAYQRLQALVSYPPVANMLIARANAGGYVQRQLEALLNERGRADGLLTVGGALRALFT